MYREGGNKCVLYYYYRDDNRPNRYDIVKFVGKPETNKFRFLFFPRRAKNTRKDRVDIQRRYAVIESFANTLKYYEIENDLTVIW